MQSTKNYLLTLKFVALKWNGVFNEGKNCTQNYVITYTNINHAAMLAYLLVESTSIPFFKGIKLPSPQAHVYSFQIALKIS